MKQPLLKAWFVALLAVAAHISFSAPDSSSFSSSPLHSEYSLACSACELIVRDVARELSRLSPDVRSSRVVDIDTNGEERDVFYEESVAFTRDALHRTCARESLARYLKRYDWLGDGYFVEDIEPVGPGHKGVADGAAAVACRRLSRLATKSDAPIMRDALVKSKSTHEFVDGVCAHAAIRCPKMTSKARRFNVRKDWRKIIERPRVALLLLPWFLTLTFVPVLLLPSVYPPQLPNKPKAS